MKTTQWKLPLLLASAGLITDPVSPAYAVEGGIGRPISGAQIMPFAGVVQPAPGFAAGVGEIYYDGSIGGNRTVPVAQNLTLGIDMKASFTPISLLYIWDTGTN